MKLNSLFTFNYSQPSEYHFSLDSVLLAQRVFQWYAKQTESKQISIHKILDLCSGCGIIGIDTYALLMSYSLKNEKSFQLSSKIIKDQNYIFSLPQSVDFLEVQTIYQSHFIKNIQNIERYLNSYFYYQLNYNQVQNYPELNEKYDLIVCNPPYFDKANGVLSESDFKNRCRFFIDSDLTALLRSLIYLLKKDAVAFVLLKDLKVHGIDLENELSKFKSELKFEKQIPIRTTDLFKITRC